MVSDGASMDTAGDALSAPIVRSAIEAVSVFQIGWGRLSGLMGLAVLGTLFEGLGVSMMLPVAELMQKGGEIADLSREQGYWRYIAMAADWTGAPPL